jgi:MOSC domain-containing protein YiiM
MARVKHLFRAPRRGSPMEELKEVKILKDKGLEGCSHGRPGTKRQILLVDLETLDVLNLHPGIIRENITTDGLDVNGLAIGQQLRVGESRLEVSEVCTPCGQIEKLRPGLRKEMRGRRGMLCRVIESGTVRPGDAIEKLPPL